MREKKECSECLIERKRTFLLLKLCILIHIVEIIFYCLNKLSEM